MSIQIRLSGPAAIRKSLQGAVVVGLVWGAALCQAAAPVDFARDVLPILSDKCFHCHGPDEQSRQADLRFDTREGAFREQDGETVIVPGQSAESELIYRIRSTDPSEVMPPKSANRDLSPEQIDLLTRWIDEGAKWGMHWAFVSPQRQPLPPVKAQDWVRNGIDRFILARLEAQGLQPAPQAEKGVLLRRVTFDLTGLPPTQAELDAFLADQSPDAFERVVDRLLGSPRYGERMAAEWLDLARYADTHGYQMDRFRPVWPYRDWVIQAFNENLPFDQFATWQLAGDLLPEPTQTQRLATAFNRLHMQNEEGGVVEEEFRVAYVTDRVNTMGTAFLGLTLECCRCHDHKYDPLTQKDYYSLFSFFQNIDESGQTSYFTAAMPVPTLLLTDPATDQRLAQLEGQIQQAEEELSATCRAADGAFETWLADREGDAPEARPIAAFSFDQLEGGKFANSAAADKPANPVEGPELTAGHAGQAVALNGENGVSFPGIGHFTRVDPWTFSLWVRPGELLPRMVVLHHSRAPIDAGSRGYELLLEDGRVAFGLHHMWPGNSLKVRTTHAISAQEWTHLTVTYDGSSRASGLQLFVNGDAAAVEVIRDGLYKDITYGDEPELAIGWRFRDNGFKGGAVDEFRVYQRRLTTLEIQHLAGRSDFATAWQTPVEELTDAQRQGLRDYYWSHVSPAVREVRSKLHSLRREHNGVVNPVPEIMVMKELPSPKPAYLLKRGAYDAPGEAVTADTPHALPPFPDGLPRNRLGLARWLLDPQHPLTARVTVNRYWQLIFGQGLVESSDNFGSQGAQPTHPELLDWLALEFSEGSPDGTPDPLPRWDVKQFLKRLVMSATYQQSSVLSPELRAIDPANHWLARGPAKRLTAEMLRDAALLQSGLLVEQLGGPSVKPYQPPGLWEIAMGQPHYDQGHGDDLHRRSLYTFWKRTVPHPAMITFDAAERNVCVARRQSTSTPLQALALLNDVQVVESARFAAERMLRSGGKDDASRVRWLFRDICSRAPTAAETVVLRQLLQEQRELFTAHPDDAAKLLAVGETRNDSQLSTIELAAGTVLAEAIFNLDEAVMRR